MSPVKLRAIFHGYKVMILHLNLPREVIWDFQGEVLLVEHKNVKIVTRKSALN